MSDPTPLPTHPVVSLDDTVHQRVRLGVLAILHDVAKADFGYLRDGLGLTDGNLSRHLQVLETAGFVAVEKGYEGRRPRTWVRATKPGRKAFEAEVAALRELLDGVGGGPAS